MDHQAPDRDILGAGLRDDYGTGVRAPSADRTRAAAGRSDTARGTGERPRGAVPAFIVTALISGKAGVRDLARRSFRWRMPLRWYAISLLAPLLILLIAVTILYGFAPLLALAQN